MNNIDSQINDRMQTYSGNPQALQQRYAQTQELVDLLALQKMKNDRAAATSAVQGAMQTPSNTVKGQLEQEAMQGSRNDVLRSMAPGIQQQGQRMAQMQNRAAMGLPTQAAPNMARMANGGIVGYADGGDVVAKKPQMPVAGQTQNPSPAYLDPEVATFLRELSNLNKQKADAFPQEKDLFDQKITDLMNTTSPRVKRIASDSPFGLPKKEGMAQGGIVGYAPGGEVDMDALLDALMIAESGGDPNAVSRAGAEGAYQIMPSTAAQPGYGVPPMEGDRFDPKASRAFARQYLQAMIDRYDGDLEAGLIAYNAGAGNADKFIAANRDYEVLPQTMQTQPYVRKIMGQLEKEGRRRDFQMGGGRTISTTAPESYTEQARRKRLEKQETGLASLYPPVAMKEAEMYEPNLPDALAVAQAMKSLSGGAEEEPVIEDLKFVRGNTQSPVEVDGRPVESYTQRNTRQRREANAPAEGIAGYFQNIGRQQQLRRDNFRRAVPGAEAAVARAAQEKADGGIGYLRRLGRLQEGAAQRQAEESDRAAKFMAMLQQNQDIVASMDPAENMPIQEFQNGGDVKRFNGEDGSFIDTLGNMQRSAYEATKDYMPDFGNIVSEQMENAVEDPLNYAANALLSIYGGGALLKGGAKVLGPIVAKHGPKVVQRAKDLALRATTKPNPAAIGPVRPPFRPPAGRVVDPVKVGVGTGLAIKAGDALFSGEEADVPGIPGVLNDMPQPSDAQRFANAFPGAQAAVDRYAEEKDSRDEQQSKGGLDIDFRALREFLAGGAGQTSTAGALAGGARGLGAFQTAEQNRQDKLNQAALEVQLKRDLAANDARMLSARLAAEYKGKMDTALIDVAQSALEDTQDPLNIEFTKQAAAIRDQYKRNPLVMEQALNRLYETTVNKAVDRVRLGAGLGSAPSTGTQIAGSATRISE